MCVSMRLRVIAVRERVYSSVLFVMHTNMKKNGL